ncbi:GntR family transcriptional regulator [Listeria costaricensis]|uniref:GntR family transcriptional regulator n=1 Tax=Listeria costaricensis TaxID=2026604 RepID=UPI000C077FDE|nr:GntR family transcriptional regulator [Listeria costaricensis]
MFSLDRTNRAPIYEQIVQMIKKQVVAGILKPDDQVPSIREMAILLGVNPNTVSKAYQELERSEVLYTMKGKGAFIAETTGKTISEKARLAAVNQLKEAVVDLLIMGLSKEEIINRVEDIYKEGQI